MVCKFNVYRPSFYYLRRKQVTQKDLTDKRSGFPAYVSKLLKRTGESDFGNNKQHHSKLKYKIFPIGVKSNDKYTIRSFIRFNKNFHQRIGESYVIHPKNMNVKEGVVYLTAYMSFCL